MWLNINVKYNPKAIALFGVKGREQVK